MDIDTTAKNEETPAVSAEVAQMEKLNESLAALTAQNAALAEQNQALTSQFQQVAELSQQQQAASQPVDQWQPKTWDEVAQKAEERAQTAAEKFYAAKEAEAQALQEQKAAQTTQVDQYLDQQLAELEKDKVIPKIKDANDPTDPGKLARQELFGFAAHAETTNLKQVAATLKELHDVGKHYDPQANKFVDSKRQAAGANAPIGSSSQRGASGGTGPTYKDIHNARDLDSLIARFDATH